jgi:hypothetical protein
MPYRQDAIADLHLSVALCDATVGESRDVNSVRAIDERLVAFASGYREAERSDKSTSACCAN